MTIHSEDLQAIDLSEFDTEEINDKVETYANTTY